MKTTLLGGLSPDTFLAEYWQKKPLLVRGAIPNFQGVLTRDEVLALACDEDCESRFIHHDGTHWQLEHGPFKARQFKRRGAWTVLAQGVNLFSDAADDLLHQFDFIPAARLDDLMVSYATDGGGVGPHFDSYDVFLLQGTGQRRWRISNQRDLTLVPDAPLRILQNFTPTDEWVLNPGDMLYLPPQYAHDGVAVGECMTWSIGFRAPGAQELASGFLEYLIEHLTLPGRYADPDLQRPHHRAEISADMIDKVARMLEQVRWGRDDIADFLGGYFTEPKQQVYFEGPEKEMSEKAFVAQLKKRGLRLHRKTQMLFCGARFYINGEVLHVTASDQDAMRELADQRRVPASTPWSPQSVSVLYDAYCDGFVVFPDEG